jgi:hypothetical protein
VCLSSQAIQKAENRRIKVQASPVKKLRKTPLSMGKSDKCTCHPSNGGKHKIGRFQSKPDWAKSKTLSPKQPEQKGLEAWLKW